MPPVLIYLGCLGLLQHSHDITAEALHVSLMAYLLYRAVRYVEGPSMRNAALLGLALGGLTLTRGWITPAALSIALLLCTVFLRLPLLRSMRHLALAVLVAIALALVWLLPGELLQPYGHSPLQAWMEWNCRQFSAPSLKACNISCVSASGSSGPRGRSPPGPCMPGAASATCCTSSCR